MNTKKILSIGGKPKDFPFKEICARANELALEGHQVYQKWTCSGCGARLGSETPNYFTETGTCDKCPAITNIKEQGCNYMLVMRDITLEEARNVMFGGKK